MSLSTELNPASPRPAFGCREAPHSPEKAPLKVFVHLAYDKDVEKWREAWAKGSLVGRNDITPYGYGRANEMGCRLTFSRSHYQTLLGRVVRLGTRAVLGFDLVHAFSQRREIFRSDVVWTHTESQFLAVSALLIARRGGPKLIGQSVWLFDAWKRFGVARRALYRLLIQRVDVLTTLSPVNAEIARMIFPGKRVEFVHFGIDCDEFIEPDSDACRQRYVVAVGNDRHRDWRTLITAANDLEGIEVEILSRTASRYKRLAQSHVLIGPAKTNEHLHAAYGRATVAVVPLTDNAHASGITAVLEAVLAGVPVIASDAGGLRSYFSEEEIVFVPVGDASALKAAIVDLARHRETALAMAARAQARVLNGPANLNVYIRRHVEISREII